MTPRRLLLIAVCYALSTLPASAANWPGFRGQGSAGVSDEKGLPTKWSDSENVVWKTDLPSPGSSSPCIWGDRIFITCYSGYGINPNEPGEQENLRLHLVCVDRKSGKIAWDKSVKARLP